MASINERVATVETSLKEHKDQCVIDKENLNTRLDAIDSKIDSKFSAVDNKLWAGLVILVVQLVGAVWYLAVNGPPWTHGNGPQQVAERQETAEKGVFSRGGPKIDLLELLRSHDHTLPHAIASP